MEEDAVHGVGKEPPGVLLTVMGWNMKKCVMLELEAWRWEESGEGNRQRRCHVETVTRTLRRER